VNVPEDWSNRHANLSSKINGQGQQTSKIQKMMHIWRNCLLVARGAASQPTRRRCNIKADFQLKLKIIKYSMCLAKRMAAYDHYDVGIGATDIFAYLSLLCAPHAKSYSVP